MFGTGTAYIPAPAGCNAVSTAHCITMAMQVCPAQAITIEAEEREDGSRKTTRCTFSAQ